MKSRERLCTYEFVTLIFVLFFAFCNMAVFYSLFNYLGKIGIDPEWRGFLISLEPMTAFILRLAIIPFMTKQNAPRIMIASLILLIPILCSYDWFTTIPWLILIRIFHGVAFVLLVSSAMAFVVFFIPKEKSGQGFGIVSISTLTPYVVMPQLTEILLQHQFRETQIYAGVSLLTIPGILLLFLLERRVRLEFQAGHSTLIHRPTLTELQENFRNRRIKALLGLSLILSVVYATFFYFLKDFAHQIGGVNAGTFFTISMLFMILIRTLGGSYFDRVNKKKALQIALSWLALSIFFLAYFRSQSTFYPFAVLYGLLMGVAYPLLNSWIFLSSSVTLRGVNTNLSIFLMDAGYTLSPFLGGLFLAAGHPVHLLFYFCSVFVLSGMALTFLLERSASPEKDS